MGMQVNGCQLFSLSLSLSGLNFISHATKIYPKGVITKVTKQQNTIHFEGIICKERGRIFSFEMKVKFKKKYFWNPK